MAEIAKRCKDAAEEMLKYARDADNLAVKKKSELDSIVKKYVKTSKPDRKNAYKGADKIEKEVLKAEKEVDKNRIDCGKAITELDGRLEELSKRVESYDILIRRVVPGLKQALQMEVEEMTKKLEEIFGAF
jgi:tellurite resistance protein